MAIEARHNVNNFFHSSHHFIVANGDCIKLNQETGNTIKCEIHTYHETILPIYHKNQLRNAVAEPVNRQSDSGLTHNAVNPAPRKRQRDDSFHQETTKNNNAQLFAASNTGNKLSKISSPYNYSLLDSDIAFQIQQQQCEIDRFVAQHTEKVRMELEKQRKQEARMVVTAFEEGIARRLQEKDEELIRMGKLNWVLQERVKTLCVENQLWKDLAQSNEATAISLRTNLEQVFLTHVSEGNQNDAAAGEDDAESCCGSSDSGRENGVVRTCRGCGEEAARVLVLPCRHLCLCASCGSHLRACPVCLSPMTASVRVNLS